MEPEEAPKPLILEKIESPLRYTWSQTYTTVELEIDSNATESQECSVLIETDRLTCSINGAVIIDAKLTETVDPKESSHTITKDKSNQLTITLQKTKVGSFWSEVFTEGQSIAGDIKVLEQPDVNVSQDDDEVKQPYNNQQLEECDQYPNENDAFLVRLDGDTHRITHQALLLNQILFTKLDPPLLCIRHDVSAVESRVFVFSSRTVSRVGRWPHLANQFACDERSSTVESRSDLERVRLCASVETEPQVSLHAS